MTERIQPDSWLRAGRAFSDASSSFQGDAGGRFAGMSVDELGCNNGGTLADTAFAIVMPTLLGALSDTAAGISEGLRIEGGGLNRTGQAYQEVEAENTRLAQGMV